MQVRARRRAGTPLAVTAAILVCLWTAWSPLHAQDGAPAARSTASARDAAAPLTTALSVRSLTAAEASLRRAVRLRAVVTYYDAARGHFFVQDGTAGINVVLDAWPALRTGDVVEITGTTDPGHFAPRVDGLSVRVTGRQPLPPARPVEVTRLTTGHEDSQFVEVHAIVRAVYPPVVYEGAGARLFVDVVSSGVRIPLYFPGPWQGPAPRDLVDARVRITAVVGAQFGASRQLIGALLYVPSIHHVVVERPALPPDSLPLQPIGGLFRYTTVGGFEHRIRAGGIVTATMGSQFYLRDDSGAVAAIPTDTRPTLRLGDRVEIAGFPETGSDVPILRDVTVLSASPGEPPQPVVATAEEILGGGMDSQFVSIEARLLQDVTTPARRTLLLDAGGVLFTAELPPDDGSAEALTGGSTVRVSGICNVVTDERDSPRVPRSFKLLLRSAGDVQVLSAPSWWTFRRMLWVVAALSGTILAAFAWVAFLRRRVREQTAVIRERLEQEIALQARYRELFENANDVICTYRADGQLVSLNRAAERVTGYSREDALQLDIANLVAPEHRGRIQDMLAETIRTGESTTFEVDLIAREGHRVTLELDTHRSTIGGTQVGVQAIGRDVTERKRTEQVLRQAKDAAESASRAKSEFVANMSHELRTPLNGIIGMTGLLMNGDLSGEQAQQLHMVKSSAEALQHVMDEVLDFAKLDSGRLVLRPQPMDLRDCLAGTLQGLAQVARDSRLSLSCRVAPAVPRVVVADPERLRQVIDTLAGNGLKFTHEGGVHVDVDAWLTDEAKAEWLVTIRVTDTGIGIPADKRQAIFEAFTQADGSMTRRYGGAGLGLAIASSLVRLMGGTVGVESEVDRGSTFSVAIPVAAQSAGDGTATRLPHVPALVIEGHAATRDVLCERLGLWGLAPAPAGSLAEASDFLRTAGGRECRVVLADAATLGGEMTALVTLLRDSAPAAKLIGCALAPRQEELDEGRRCGVVAFLPKPCRDGELLAACEAAVKPPARASEAPAGAGSTVPSAARPGVILLVEDNVINQRVAEQILARRGHEVRIAHNGRQAVDVLERWTPDLVFMDVQMPEMNGIDATRAIRAREARMGGHVPIIALTAHALPTDREQCLRAGMDDYLTKPVSPVALTQTVERIVEQRMNDNNNGAQHAAGAAGSDAVLDPALALERVDGDRELLGEIIDLFFQDVGSLVQDLEQAVGAKDAEAIMRTAHRLKGSVATFAAKPATEAALRLETMGRSGDVSGVEAAFSALQAELTRLEPALQELRVAQ